jgi:hypothetical protein
MRWAGHVAHVGDRKGVYRVGCGDHLENVGVDGRIILKWIFMKWDKAWTGFICLRIRTGGGLL